MNTHHENQSKATSIPLAAIRKKKEFSLVWVVPIVAILIAGGLVYKAVTEKGPTITITFKSAEGIEAGKTKIKYKDVEMGEIETIVVSDDLKSVIMTAQMNKKTKPYLTTKARFWVVRARLSAGNVSGLGTLLSGGYISFDPGLEGEPQNHFSGMEIPPVIMSDEPGRTIHLKSPKLGSLERGSPVYFKGIKAGRVEEYAFMDQDEFVDIKVFIEAPYDKKVISSTRFWFSSGLDVDLSAKGLRIDSQSFVSMMIGGLVFANPDHIEKGAPITEETILPIYDSFDEAMAIQYTEKLYYLLKFNHSVRGLSIGAPVEFRGFPIGEVSEIGLEADWKTGQFKIPVKIQFEPDRLQKLVQNRENPKNSLENLIDMGMRAQLQTGNLITGSLFVSIDFFETAEPASLVVHDDIIELPTIPTSLDELKSSLTALLNKLEKLPIEELGDSTLKIIHGLDETSKSFRETANSITRIVSSDETKDTLENLNQSLASVRSLTAEIEQQLPPAFNKISEKTIDTLTGIQKVTAPDSALIFELEKTLREFSRTAQSIRTLTDQLERHPESILQGKGKEK